jgi:hypothetical protein
MLVGVCLYPIVVAPDTACAVDPGPKPPEYRQVEQAVRSYFKSLATYEPGDIITRSQVEPLLGQEKSMGWLGAERAAILARLLNDEDFLVTELRTPAGRAFLPQIANYPGGLDRLDHLSRLNQGKKSVRNVIRVRDGYKLIETLATTPNGTALGKSLSKSPGGADFNKPTGRIYTVDMLLERLKQVHQTKSAPTASTK